jgi:hypothetical protein
MTINISTDRLIGVVIVLLISLFTWVWNTDNRLIEQELSIKQCIDHQKQVDIIIDKLDISS